jgi:hypothetical protein
MPKTLPFENMEDWCRDNKGLFSLGQVAEAVSVVTGKSLDQLRTPKQDRLHSDARKLFSWFCLALDLAGLKELGRYLCKTHTAPLHQQRKAEALFNQGDEAFTASALSIHEKLKAILNEDVQRQTES